LKLHAIKSSRYDRGTTQKENSIHLIFKKHFITKIKKYLKTSLFFLLKSPFYFDFLLKHCKFKIDEKVSKNFPVED